MDSNIDFAGKEAFKHAQHGPGQSHAEANQKMNEFVSGKLATHSVDDFGDALHTIQDYTSPLHRDASFEPTEWGGSSIARSGGHLFGESSPTDDWARFGLAVKMSMYTYMMWDPTASQKGLTKSSFMGEYKKRISNYINSFYWGLLAEMGGSDPSNYFAIQHELDNDAEAARLCALGAPAACVK